MKRYGVRPSVPFSRCSNVRSICSVLCARSIVAWPAPQQHEATARHAAANAGSATFSAYLRTLNTHLFFTQRGYK